MDQAKILSVSIETTGDVAAVDHAVGATTLILDDVSDFPEEYGSVSIAGVIYAYDSRDEDLNTLHLITPLTVAVTAEDEVLSYPLSDEKQAFVDLEDDDDAKWAVVPHTLKDRLTVGIRDETARETVWVQKVDEDEYTIVDVVGQVPFVDASYVDPSTLPQYSPAAPPAVSPTLTVTATPRGLIVQTTGIETGSLIDYHISTTDGFTPGPTTLWNTTASTVVNIENLHDGTALKSAVTYYLVTQAHNSAGYAPASPQVSSQLRLNDDSTIASLAVSKLIAGDLIGGFALLGSLQIGNITLDPTNGLIIPQPNGGTITLPADGSAATVTADLVAYSLKVINNLIISGTVNEISTGSLVNLANGISKPSAKPSVGATWPTVVGALDGAFTSLLRGLVINGTDYASASAFFQDGSIEFFNTTTGARGIPISMPASFAPYGGLTKIGTNWYVMGRDFTRGGDWYIYKFNSSWVKQAESKLYAASTYNGAIGTDGTAIWVARPYGGYVYTYTIAAASIGTTLSLSSTLTDVVANEDVYDINVGTFDLATNTAIISLATRHWAVDEPSNVVNSAKEWPRAAGANIHGLWWDGTRFHVIDDQATIRKYSTNTAGLHSVGYSWYDSDAAGTGTHETQMGTTKSYTLAYRAWLTVGTAPPNDTGDADAPDSVRIYVSSNAGAYVRQADLGPGVTSATYDKPLISGTAPPASNGFSTSGAPGSLETPSGLTFIRGDDTFAAPKKMQAGQASVSAVSGQVNQTVTFPVAFPTGTTPIVTTTLQVATPTSGRTTSVATVTNTSFSLRVLFDATATITVNWFAFIP